MKHVYLFLLVLVTSLAAAQSFVIDASYNPAVGDKYTGYSISNTSGEIAAGAAGINQKWDFSAYAVDSAYLVFGDPLPASRKSLYPNAGVVIRTQYGDSTFYETSALQSLNWGLYSTKFGLYSYSDAQMVLKYPFAYGDTFEDSIRGKGTVVFQSLKVNTIRKGKEIVTADGYGSLVLTGGQHYDKAIRIKTIIHATDSAGPNFGNTVLASDITSYTWYAEGVSYPVLNIVEIKSALDTSLIAVQCGPYDSAVSATIDSELANSISISPNPCHDALTIFMDNKQEGAFIYTIKDLNGKALLSLKSPSNNGHGPVILNTSSLPSGLYLLEIGANGKTASRKIIKN